MIFNSLLKKISILLAAGAAISAFSAPAGIFEQKIVPLTVEGENFLNPGKKKVRLWGVNLASFYPDRETAEKTAENLSSLGVNCARPHHLMRRSMDWNPRMVSGALMTYKNDSMTPDQDAWKRFDYFNYCLRKNGIYLMLPIGSSRSYHPGDAKILPASAADREAWGKAVSEINGWHWKKSHDVKKMLPLIDERAALVNEDFVRKLLGHVNPYTKIQYGKDPQLLTIEILNEFSLDYAVICQNKFPAYWDKKLRTRWAEYTRKHNVQACDFYKPRSKEQIKCRGRFMWDLEQKYYNRIAAVVRECGFKGPVAFSNLWRGEWASKFNSLNSGYIEDHSYSDPRVEKSKKDFFIDKSYSRLADKPYIIGELNHVEGGNTLKASKRARAMMPLVAASYGGFNNWAGIIWFAWAHGDSAVGADGWAKSEGRISTLGNMVKDGMTLDHFRTSALIFRHSLVKESAKPQIIYVDGDLAVNNYYAMVRGKSKFKAGWQSIHALKKKFGRPPAGDKTPALLNQKTPDKLVSDTGEIIKDTAKGYLEISSPYAEAFAGELKSPAKVSLKHMSFSETDGFTVIAMASTGTAKLSQAGEIIISRTNMDKNWKESDKGILTLKGLNTKNKKCVVTVTRPRSAAGNKIAVKSEAGGIISFPVKGWHECVLEIK
jgi:hypothetical protein